MASDKLKRGPHNLFVSYAKGEVEFRKKHFNDVQDLYKYQDEWKCTVCSTNLEKSILKGSFCKHPSLGVLVCHNCLEYYGDGLFSPDEEGEDKFCRWCAQGGELYCCSNCVCTFCKKCIHRHFKENRKVMKGLDSEDWKCFLCESKPIWFLRALCWAVYNFKNDFVNNLDESNSRKRNGKGEIKESSSRRSKDTEDEDSSEEEQVKKKLKGPKSKHYKRKTSSDEDGANSDEEVSRKRIGSKSKVKKSSDKRKNSKESEEESSSEERPLNSRMGPKSKVNGPGRSDRNTRNRKDSSSDEEESKRSRIGPKSKVGKSEKSFQRRTRKSQESDSEKEEEAEEEKEISSEEEKPKKSRPGPKSKVGKRETRTRNKIKSENEEEADSSEEEEKPKKSRPGPRSKREKSEKSSDRRTKIKQESDNEEEEDENSSEEKEKSKKSKIGPKSKVEKTVRSSDRRARNRKQSESEEEEKPDSEEEEEEKSSYEDEKSRKSRQGPKSKVEKPERKTKSSRNEDKRKDTSDEEEEPEKPVRRTKRRKASQKEEEEESDNENEIKKHIKSEVVEDETNNGKSGADKSTLEPKSPSEMAVKIFQEALDLCENLAADIQKKTDKLKKLASSDKFRSARNTHKIYSLLNKEMQKNSALFTHLSELVEDRIAGIDDMFKLDNDTINSIYEQPTLASNTETAEPQNEDVNMEEAPETSTNTSRDKKTRHSSEAKDNIPDSKVDISSILSSDNEKGTSKSEGKTKSKVSKDVKGILTSDSDEPREDEKMDVDNEPENTNVGLEDILNSDDSNGGDNAENMDGNEERDGKDVDENEAAKASLLNSDSDEKETPKRRSARSSRTPSKGAKENGSKSKADEVTIKSILESDSDEAGDTKEAAQMSKSVAESDLNENEAVNLDHILTSDSDNEKPEATEAPSGEGHLSEYHSARSESELDSSGGKNKKPKRRGSCKDDPSETEKEPHDSNDDDKSPGKKSKKQDKDDSGSKSRRKSDSDGKKLSKAKSSSISNLSSLSSLDNKRRREQREKSSAEESEESKVDTSSKEKKSEGSKTDTSTRRKKTKEDDKTSLLEFLNEEDSSEADDLEESTELLSSLIKAKAEEAKKQNEEMVKQALLRADDESNKEESGSEIESEEEADEKKEKKRNGSKDSGSETEKKSKKKSKDSSSDSDKKSKKKKDSWRNDPLLRGKLSDTDESEGEKKFEAKMKKAQDTITLSSDEELIRKKPKREASSDDSDCFVLTKKKNPVKRRKARLRDSSDSSDVLVITSDESKDSSDSDFKKKEKKKKKRSRIKKMKDSDDSDSDIQELNTSQGTPGKGRKNIRHILSNEELAQKTINASKAEEERKRRIEERQALYNKLFKIPEDSHEAVTKLVLDFDEKTKTELISVHPDLVCKLKPHQVEGVRFMFNACFESAQQIKKNKAGSGCILAHCMGLGKTLQVVTLVHTLMTHQELTKVNRVMVVTPLNTVSNWVDEFDNWLKKINNGDDIETFNLIKSKKDYERSYTLNCWFEEGGVLIIGYEMFRNLINKRGLSKKVKTIVQKTLLDPGPDLVVCDEGHILKNETSAVSKAMCQIRTLRRIILTGTPLQNNLEEYHCMVQFVKPNLLGDRKEFKNRFANPINNGQYIDSTPRDVKIMKRRAHVLYKMLDGIVQRKDYNVLTPFLPPKYEYVISIKLTDLQIKLYSHYLQSHVNTGDNKPRLFADYQTLKLVWTHPYALKSASVHRQKRQEAKLSDSEGSLRDFIDDDDEEEEDGSDGSSGSATPPPRKKTRAGVKAAKESGEPVVSEEEKEEEAEAQFWWTNLVSDEDIEDITNSNKLLAFMFVLKQCEEIGDKLLVFSQSLETLSLLEYFLNRIDEASQDGTLDQNLSQFQASWTLGLDYFRLDGSSSSEDRSYWVKSFNNPTNLRARLFLISTKAGGLGINLVAANRVIIFDVSWNPSHDIQSIFRVFRFGQTKPCYIYRFLAQGTMEEKIYDRQVAKQSMSCRVVDEQQIDRHFTRSDIHELYEFKPDEKKERKTPALPKDRLMAEMIKEMDSKIVAFHEHDSLLENIEDEELNEEERKAAWEEFESEKSRPAMSAGMTYVNNLIMQNNMRQQQQGLQGGVGMAANAANLKLDSQHMLNYLKNSNPDVSENALLKIVEQNAQRLEDYKKKQEQYFHYVINNMHQGMQQRANMMPNMGGAMGQQFPMMNRMPMTSAGVGNPLRNPIPFPRGVGSTRPTILSQAGRPKTTAADMMRRVAPLASSTPKPASTGEQRKPPRRPQEDGAAGTSAKPIDIEL
ncbi:hypothetical protein M8J77_011475 [Diaphorina citri]|nr:hypothetical protein M8J77_011475 [Diaphorina citri]